MPPNKALQLTSALQPSRAAPPRARFARRAARAFWRRGAVGYRLRSAALAAERRSVRRPKKEAELHMLKVLAVLLLAAIGVLGARALLRRRSEPTREEVISCIESFLDGTCGPHDWDDFTSASLKAPELEAVRRECAAIRDLYPPTVPGWYTSDQGFQELRRIVAQLRAVP